MDNRKIIKTQFKKIENNLNSLLDNYHKKNDFLSNNINAVKIKSYQIESLKYLEKFNKNKSLDEHSSNLLLGSIKYINNKLKIFIGVIKFRELMFISDYRRILRILNKKFDDLYNDYSDIVDTIKIQMDFIKLKNPNNYDSSIQIYKNFDETVIDTIENTIKKLHLGFKLRQFGPLNISPILQQDFPLNKNDINKGAKQWRESERRIREIENLIDQFYIDLSNMKKQLTTLGYDFRITELETESGTTFFDDI